MNIEKKIEYCRANKLMIKLERLDQGRELDSIIGGDFFGTLTSSKYPTCARVFPLWLKEFGNKRPKGHGAESFYIDKGFKIISLEEFKNMKVELIPVNIKLPKIKNE